MAPRILRVLPVLLWIFIIGSDQIVEVSSSKDNIVHHHESAPLSIGNLQIRLQPDEVLEGEDSSLKGSGSESYKSILNQFRDDIQQINNHYRSELKQIILDITEQIQKARERNQAHRNNVTSSIEEQFESAVTLAAQDRDEVEDPTSFDTSNNDVNASNDISVDPVDPAPSVIAEIDEDTCVIEDEPTIMVDGKSVHGTVEHDYCRSVGESSVAADEEAAIDDVDQLATGDADTDIHGMESGVTSNSNFVSSELRTDVKSSRKRKNKKVHRASPDSLPSFVTPKKQAAFVTSKPNDVAPEICDDDVLEIIEGDFEEDNDDDSDTELFSDDEPFSMNKTVGMAMQKVIQAVVTSLIVGILYSIVQRLVAIIFRILFTKNQAATDTDRKSDLSTTKGKGILQPQP